MTTRRTEALATTVVLVGALFAPGCAKPRAFAPTQDFARRHHCPASKVETTKEGSSRVRVSGCGESELYVRRCENRSPLVPPEPEPQPMSEPEARHGGRPNPDFSESGCAWSREPENGSSRFGGE